jgi:site-specific DNA-methyltransferase (adenine-specific)
MDKQPAPTSHGRPGDQPDGASIAPSPDYATTDGRHHIYVGDCESVLPAIASQSVSIVVTSPPYNVGLAYASYRDKRPRADYLDWLSRIFEEVSRILRPDGSLFVNVGASNTDPWLSMDVAQVARARFVLQNRIAWVKSVAIGERTHGHFKPINSARFLNNCS